MDERPDQIVEHIERERHTLGRNLDELQNRIKSTTDWRTQFDRHPMAMLGAAMGGGLLIGAMVGGVKSRGSSSSSWRKTSGVSSRSYAGGSYLSSSYTPSSGSSRSDAGSSYMGSSYTPSSSSSPYSSPASSAGSSHQPSGTASSAMHSLLSTSSPAISYQRSKAMEAFDNIKGALLAYGIAQARDWLNQMLPGFSQHYDETAKRSQNQQHQGQQKQGEQNRPEWSGASQQNFGSGSGSMGNAPGHTGGSHAPQSSPGYGSSQPGSMAGSGTMNTSTQTPGSGSSHTTSQTPNPGSTRHEPTPAL